MPHPATPQTGPVQHRSPRHISGLRQRLGCSLWALSIGLGLTWMVAPWQPVQAQTAGYSANQADEAATLVADQVAMTGPGQLKADGNVEIYWKGNRLTAPQVTYDQDADRIHITGPLRLTQPGSKGDVLLASQADLSRDMQNGILIGARMVVARELQIAAQRAERKDGLTTTLYDSVASSCQVCASDPTPLWEIRARKITHDATARTLKFEDAQFRLMGVPLMWTPALRMPDPTVERMAGILRPRFTNSTELGFGVELPYFIPLGPSADLTLKPHLTTEASDTLGGRYRQAFNNGFLNIDAALTRDNMKPDNPRGYIFANADFWLPGSYHLGLQLQSVTDAGYLTDYDVSDIDRLWTGVTLDKVTRNELIQARIGNSHSIREWENNSTQPSMAGDYSWTRLFSPRYIGGLSSIEWNVHALHRSSTLDYDTLKDYDLIPDGRDMLRTSLEANWRRNWILPAGVVAATQARLAGDVFSVRDDAVYRGDTVRVQPTIGTEIRWPWVKTTGDASHVIEPVAQILWSPNHLKDAPDEDSPLTELDEGNLFSMSRFPGGDARERGTRANLGLSWTRLDATGWSFGVTGGRIYWTEDLDQFSEGSGLSGRRSDWFLSGTLATPNGLTVANRALFDDEMSFSRDELRFSYFAPKYRVSSAYIWMKAEPLQGRATATNELELNGGMNLNDTWSSTVYSRYDFTAARMARAGLGLRYVNECLTMDLSLSRRFTSSSSVNPETSMGFSVQLAGFGAGSQTGGAARACRG